MPVNKCLLNKCLLKEDAQWNAKGSHSEKGAGTKLVFR